MKILLISSRFYPFTGGVENVVLNLAKEFKAKGHEVLVIASRMGEAQRKSELVEGIEVQRVWMNLPRSFLGYVAFPLRFGIGLVSLIQLIRKFRPDVVNYHFPDDSSVYVWLATKIKSNLRRGVACYASTIIVNIHGNDLQVFGKKPWYRFFLKKLINKAQNVIVNSTYIKNDLQDNFPGSEEKIKIIPNAVDEKFFNITNEIASFKPRSEARTLKGATLSCAGCPLAQAGACGPQGLSEDIDRAIKSEKLAKDKNQVLRPVPEPGSEELASFSPYILYLGRLVHKKGVDLLLNAYATAKNDLESNLVIVGDGGERAKLENMVREKDLEGKIHFVGFKSGNELLQYIHDAKFAVIPSRREPFGIVALELTAARKAIVASSTGGLAEILEDKKTALLFENGNTKDLAKKMITLENDGTLRKTLAENAKRIAKKYRWGEIAKEYIDTYKNR